MGIIVMNTEILFFLISNINVLNLIIIHYHYGGNTLWFQRVNPMNSDDATGPYVFTWPRTQMTSGARGAPRLTYRLVFRNKTYS